jgi:uncharacterized protein YndB with AHSA1/START domain
MTAAAEKPTATKELTITRLYDAPRALMFKMWTDPKHMAQWWGPKMFTNPVCEIDARVGGKIWIIMRGPKGSDYDQDFPMSGTFREVIPNERLVFMAVAEDHDGNHLIESLTTVTVEDVGGKTKLTMHARAIGLAPIAVQMLAGMDAGWNGSLDKLAELVRRAT